MRKGTKAGVSKLYVGDGQADKLGWTSLTALGHIERYSHLLFPLLHCTSHSFSRSQLRHPPQPSILRSTKSCQVLSRSSNSTLPSTIIYTLCCSGHETLSPFMTKTIQLTHTCVFHTWLSSVGALSRHLIGVQQRLIGGGRRGDGQIRLGEQRRYR